MTDVASDQTGSHIRYPKEYNEGRRSYETDGEVEAPYCPYPISDDRRVHWWVGYYDARTATRLAAKGIYLDSKSTDRCGGGR